MQTDAPDPDRSDAESDGGSRAPEDELDRRGFLNLGWKVLGAALVVEAGWTSYDLLKPPPASGGFGGAVDAGPVSDYGDGVVRYFLDGRFYVTSYRGGLRALYQKCPHLGCRVPFCQSSGRFECPCHGSVYNIVGEYIAGPAPRGMDRFPISIRGDRVIVDTSNVAEGPPRGILDGPSTSSGPSCLGETSSSAGAPPGGTEPTGSPTGGAQPSAEAS
jgi:cytochrome b6-f complex iron-sulfur subunit